MKAPAKKQGVGSKKTPAKRKKVVSAKSICRKVIQVAGINKRTGQLLKGWHYVNGKPVKATKKKAVSKRKTPNKKGLGVATPFCVKQNPDHSSTIYGSSGGDNPCPRGGRLKVEPITMTPRGQTPMNGVKPRKKTATAKQLEARKKFVANVRAGKYKK